MQKVKHDFQVTNQEISFGIVCVIQLTSLPLFGFIAQLVEQRTGNGEVTGSNPVEALIFFFFQASSFQLLKLENLLR